MKRKNLLKEGISKIKQYKYQIFAIVFIFIVIVSFITLFFTYKYITPLINIILFILFILLVIPTFLLYLYKFLLWIFKNKYIRYVAVGTFVIIFFLSFLALLILYVAFLENYECIKLLIPITLILIYFFILVFIFIYSRNIEVAKSNKHRIIQSLLFLMTIIIVSIAVLFLYYLLNELFNLTDDGNPIDNILELIKNQSNIIELYTYHLVMLIINTLALLILFQPNCIKLQNSTKIKDKLALKHLKKIFLYSLLIIIFISTLISTDSLFDISSTDDYKTFGLKLYNLTQAVNMCILILIILNTLDRMLDLLFTLFFINSKFYVIVSKIDLFRLSYFEYEKDFYLLEKLKSNRYFISKGEDFNEADYLSLIINCKYELITSNVDLLFDNSPNENNTTKTDDNKSLTKREYEKNDVLLLNTKYKNHYSILYLKLREIESDKIINFKVEIENKQIFSIKNVSREMSIHNFIFDSLNSVIPTKKSKDNYAKNKDVAFHNIKLGTSKYLNLYFKKDTKVKSKSYDEFNLKPNVLNYLQSSFGSGKTSFISENKKKYSKIYYFSLNSNDVRSSIYETLYFELTHSSSILDFKLILFFITTILSVVFSILITEIIDGRDLLCTLAIFLVILLLVIGAVYFLKDFLLALNITNKYVKEKTYIKKTLNYLNKNNILLVIEDFDRTTNLDRMEATLNFFSKISEEFNSNKNNLEILVTGKSWLDYENEVYTINGLSTNTYQKNDLFEKIFKYSYVLDLNNEFDVLKKYYENLFPLHTFESYNARDFRLLKDDIPLFKFSHQIVD